MPRTDDQDSRSSNAQDEPIYGDNSGPLFSIYSKSVEKSDNAMCERWQKDADGMIIFNGLFSAVTATLIAASLQDLRPGLEDTSAFYLQKLYELQASPDTSRPSALATPPAFSPPRYAIWVNSLWLASLVISLTCAILATSLQQWARRYHDVSHHAGRSLKERAQVHSFLASGMTKFRFNPIVQQALPSLVHLSLFIFFAGLIIYLFNINHAVFSAVACCVALSSAIYGFITFMPIIWPDSPYYSPLTQPAWFLCTRFSYVIMSSLDDILSPFFPFGSHGRIRRWMDLCEQQKDWGHLSVFLDTISNQSAEINFRILKWTVHDLYEDDKLEEIFESIPDFLTSKEVILDYTRAQVMTENAMSQFLVNTLLSNSVPELVQVRRLTKCLNVAHQVLLPAPSVMFHALVELNWGGRPHSVEIGRSLRTWDQGSNGRFTPYIRGVIAVIIAKAQERNVSWTKLARDNLPTGVPEMVFQYLIHSDSVLLTNLVHFTRHANRIEPFSPESVSFSIAVVRVLSQFTILATLPDLQRDFCEMWNELVQKAQNSGEGSNENTKSLLRMIWPHYVTLHQGVDAALPENFNVSGIPLAPFMIPPSFPLCKTLGCHEDPKHYAPDAPIPDAARALTPPPATLPTLNVPSLDFVSPRIAHISSSLAHPDDTTMQLADGPPIPPMPTPIPPSSDPPPPAMPQPYPSPVAPSPANASQQTTAHRRDISSDRDHSTLVNIPTAQRALLPSAGSATAVASLSSPMIPMVSFLPPSSSLPNSISPTSSPQFPVPSLSGSNYAPFDQGIPPSKSTHIIPPVPPIDHQRSPEHDPMAASSAETDDPPDKSGV